MYTFLLVVHILSAVLLITVILIQRGRGGGLVGAMSGMESMFGTKTNQILTRATTIFAVLFLSASVSLAVVTARGGRSLIGEDVVSSVQEEGIVQEEATQTEEPIESGSSVTEQGAISPASEQE